jgi:hypothetical protein
MHRFRLGAWRNPHNWTLVSFISDQVCDERCQKVEMDPESRTLARTSPFRCATNLVITVDRPADLARISQVIDKNQIRGE